MRECRFVVGVDIGNVMVYIMGMEHKTKPTERTPNTKNNPKELLVEELRKKGLPAVASAGMTLWIADPDIGIRTAYRWIPVRGSKGIFLLEDAVRIAEDAGVRPQEAFCELPKRVQEVLAHFWIQVELAGSPVRHTEVCLWSPPHLRVRRYLGIGDPIPKIDTRPLRRRSGD